MESQAEQVAQLERHSHHLQEAMAALRQEEDHSLQRQRRLVAAAEEEVRLHRSHKNPQELHAVIFNYEA